jgi:hypothetical protein
MLEPWQIRMNMQYLGMDLSKISGPVLSQQDLDALEEMMTPALRMTAHAVFLAQERLGFSFRNKHLLFLAFVPVRLLVVVRA